MTKIEMDAENDKTTTQAHALETQQLNFKRFSHENHKKKLSSLLREYTVAFANSDGGTLLLGIEDNIIGLEAITGCHNYSIDEMRKMVFGGTRPSIIAEIEELPQPEGMVLADKNAPHPVPIDYDRLSHIHGRCNPLLARVGGRR